MRYEEIENHLIELGIEPLTAEGYVPFGDEVWSRVAPQSGAYVPDAVRKLCARFGGFGFADGAFYHDPESGSDQMAGWFLDGPEMLEAFDAYGEVLPEGVVPITNDGMDNHLALGVGPSNSGVVYFHIHDAPLDEHLYVVNDSVEDFLMSLHRES
jgi:hypothetical protein